MTETKTEFPEIPWIPRDHNENRKKIPAEELERYRGMQVAYSWDGSRIVAGAPTWEELYQRLDEAGVEPSRVVLGYVEEQ